MQLLPLSLFFSHLKKESPATRYLSTSLQTLKSLVLCSELRSAFSPLRKTISSRLLLWAYPIRRPSARVPHTSEHFHSTAPHVPRVSEPTSTPAPLQGDRPSRVLSGLLPLSSGCRPRCGPALAQSRCQRGVLQMRIRLGGALNATSAGAGCAKSTKSLGG